MAFDPWNRKGFLIWQGTRPAENQSGLSHRHLFIITGRQEHFFYRRFFHYTRSETDRTGGVYLKDLSGLYCPRTMGSLWGSIMLLCGVLLLRTEGSGAQQTKNNVPRLKLSYKGEFLAFALSIINGKSLNDSALLCFV